MLRQNSFQIRASKIWNSLPEPIVNSPSLNAFKNSLDKFWINQDIKYDNYRAEINIYKKTTSKEVMYISHIGPRPEVEPDNDTMTIIPSPEEAQK